MEINKVQNQEASLTDAYSLFVYAIRTKITRDYYLRRLRTFFNFIKLLPSSTIECRCNEFAALAIKDQNWTFSKIIGFLQFQKERVQREEMKTRIIRFDDPKHLGEPSPIFIDAMMRYELLDYARRYFERKGDESSMKRAEEIRKLYKQTIIDSVYMIRSLLPDDVKDDYYVAREDYYKGI